MFRKIFVNHKANLETDYGIPYGKYIWLIAMAAFRNC
jgi:hypothetical protein